MASRPWYQITAEEAAHLRRLAEEHESEKCAFVDQLRAGDRGPLHKAALALLKIPWKSANTKWRGARTIGDIEDYGDEFNGEIL